MTATQELVVPKSIPIILAIIMFSLISYLVPVACFQFLEFSPVEPYDCLFLRGVP
jgi:hypothetical protein